MTDSPVRSTRRPARTATLATLAAAVAAASLVVSRRMLGHAVGPAGTIVALAVVATAAAFLVAALRELVARAGARLAGDAHAERVETNEAAAPSRRATSFVPLGALGVVLAFAPVATGEDASATAMLATALPAAYAVAALVVTARVARRDCAEVRRRLGVGAVGLYARHELPRALALAAGVGALGVVVELTYARTYPVAARVPAVAFAAAAGAAVGAIVGYLLARRDDASSDPDAP